MKTGLVCARLLFRDVPPGIVTGCLTEPACMIIHGIVSPETHYFAAIRLPAAWIALAPVRQLRAQLRHRVSLARLGTQLRNRIHAVAADHGHDRTRSYWTGPGRGWLAELDLPPDPSDAATRPGSYEEDPE